MTAISIGMSPRRHARPFVHAVGAFGLGMVLLAAFLVVAGYDAGAAFSALWDGAFGTWYAFTSVTLVHATPLIALGAGFAFAANAGALNVGMEGQFAAGAVVATWVGTKVGGAPAAIAILAVLASGILGGMIWVTLPVLLRLKASVSEVISTLLLNFVAVALVSFLVTGPMQEPSHNYPESAQIAPAAHLPHFGAGSRLHLGVMIVAMIAVLLSVLLRRTTTGFTLRAVGAAPRAAWISGGIHPAPRIALALLVSGALAGLGGSVEVSGTAYALYQNLSPGFGFTAIAVALLARMSPALVLISGSLFGALEAGAGQMQRTAGVPAVAVQVVEATVILVAAIATRKRR